MFQAPTQDNPAQQAPAQAATPLEAAAAAEPGADEQPTTRRRTRRGASADAEDTGSTTSTRRARRGSGADGAQSVAGQDAATDGSHGSSTNRSRGSSTDGSHASATDGSHGASTDGSHGASAGDSRTGDSGSGEVDGDGGTRTRTRRTRRGAPSADAAQAADGSQAGVADGTQAASGDAEESGSTRTRTRRSRRGAETSVVDAEADAPAEADAQVDGPADGHGDDGEEGGEGTRRRRRRRGGRRRRKGGDADGADDSTDEHSDDDQDDDTDRDGAGRGAKQDGGRDGRDGAKDGARDGGKDGAKQDGSDSDSADDEHDSDDDEGGSGSSRRRRRRRRRKGEDSGSSPDDPDETVVRVREPRSKNTANEITAVEGSTRLEAKKQRRREGRAAGRRRAPIVTEAEFLARRESVERTMVIRSREDLTQIAVSEDNVLVEHYVTTAEQTSLIGNVYLGRVQNVLPSMEAAFIDIGKGRNAVLYAGEVDWATLGGANGPRKIEQVLKSGQSVLVQVTKDPIGHKGARLTNQISLPGRYVVYVPRGGNGGISRKLPDTERNRLKTILKDIVPDEAGVIVRTAAEGASEEELTADVSRLQAAWEDIEKKSKNGQAPQLLYGEPDLLIRVVRDLFTEDFAKLVISGDQAYDQVREYVAGVAPHLVDRVEKAHNDVFANYRIDEQIKKALDRKVWLPSGGSLIIDRTEAMTVVDVNTGKFTGSGGNLEETVTKNNLEAAEEIVRQLRLRDIGGIIVIDFIDMVLESNRDLVLRRLVECLGRDRTKHQVAEVTSLGLVQMTRKRIGTGLLEAFSENCDHCGGRGLILHDEPKESRRRDSRNNGAAANGGNGNGNGQEHGKAAQPEESGRKSSRRRRGKNRGEDEPAAEAEAPQHNGDAAQRLAQIAAASVKKDDEPGTPSSADADTPEPTGYPIAGTEAHVSPEATGFPAADSTESADAAQNGAGKSTRRRRSSRSRSKATTDGDGAGGSTDAAELVSTHG
nr:Rne/Rng family ribonuclease [Kribbella solani]